MADPGLVHWSPANSCEALVVMRGIEFLRELRLEAVDCAFELGFSSCHVSQLWWNGQDLNLHLRVTEKMDSLCSLHHRPSGFAASLTRACLKYIRHCPFLTD